MSTSRKASRWSCVDQTNKRNIQTNTLEDHSPNRSVVSKCDFFMQPGVAYFKDCLVNKKDDNIRAEEKESSGRKPWPVAKTKSNNSLVTGRPIIVDNELLFFSTLMLSSFLFTGQSLKMLHLVAQKQCFWLTKDQLLEWISRVLICTLSWFVWSIHDYLLAFLHILGFLSCSYPTEILFPLAAFHKTAEDK